MKSKKAIIFGSNGQDGFYLNKLLIEKGIKTILSSKTNSDFNGNIGDYNFVKKIIHKIKPDYIFHFAASSVTNHEAIFENNVSISTGTINVLEACRLESSKSKIFISGSAIQFLNDSTPISEKTPFQANNPYSLARIHSVYTSRYYRKKFNLKVYVGYFFNHDSPLRSSKHINKKIIKFLNNVLKGSTEKLLIGDINAKKEFNFAGDIVNAVWILINQENIFEAVIGSGKTYSIKKWIEYCFEKYDLLWSDYIEIDKNFVKPYNVLVSDPKLILSLGWQPKVNFYELADLMLDYSIKN